MYQIAYTGWEGTIAAGFKGFSEEVNMIKVGFVSLAQPGDEQQLQNKHLVIGLLLMLNHSTSRGVFCLTKAEIYMYNQAIGRMVIAHGDQGFATTTSPSVTLDESNTTRDTIDSWRRDLRADSGEIVDPEDSNFVITYEMLGTPIPCQSLLSAALNGLAQSSLFSNDNRCNEFAGFSSSKDVTFQILTPPAGTTRFVLNYLLVKTFFKLLPAELYKKSICGEVQYQFLYGGESIGGGNFRLSDFLDKDKVVVGQ